ncbi:MAG: DUF932 domain-containing protein [Planctomycetota bacterium]
MKTFENVLEALDFPVSKRDNLFRNKNGKIERGVGQQIYRSDMDVAIANVSDTYGLIPHIKALRPILSALDGMDFDIKDFYQDHFGKRVMVKAISRQGWVVGKLPKGQRNIDHGTGTLGNRPIAVDDDEVRMTLMFSNSYDRTQALKINVGGYRMICSNGMVVEHPAFAGLNINYKVVHSQHQAKTLNLGNLGNDVARMFGAMEQQAEAWRLMKQTKIANRALESIKENVLLPITGERALEKVTDLAYAGKGQDGTLTLWALYNGLTEHYTKGIEKSKTPVSAHETASRKAGKFLEAVKTWQEANSDLVTVNA